MAKGTSSGVGSLERLLAIEEICRLKARYFRYIDCQQWERLPELFAPDAIAEFGPEFPFHDVESFVAWTMRHHEDVRVAHYGHMPEIDILDANRARGIWALHAIGGQPERGGNRFYLDEYQRINGTWLISKWSLRYVWTDDKPMPFDSHLEA